MEDNSAIELPFNKEIPKTLVLSTDESNSTRNTARIFGSQISIRIENHEMMGHKTYQTPTTKTNNTKETHSG